MIIVFILIFKKDASEHIKTNESNATLLKYAKQSENIYLDFFSP